MGFGTPQYDLMSNGFSNKAPKSFHKKKFHHNKKEQPVALIENDLIHEKDPMVKYPQLPEGWVKQTITGNASYDETVIEISNKLKRTIVSVSSVKLIIKFVNNNFVLKFVKPPQQDIGTGKKRKKVINL